MKDTFNFYAFLFVAFYAIIGFCVFQDYGISWDESFQHDYGKAVYEFVFNDSKALFEHNSRYHGPFFQFVLYSAEKLAGLSDSREIFRFRHLLTFLFSVFGVGFFYLLLRELRFRKFWSTVGILFLVSAPRLFAHSFYNSKDAVFMYAFIVATFTMLRFLRKTSWKTALTHGLTCAVLIDIRILGFFIPLFTGALWVITLYSGERVLKNDISMMFAFGATTLLLTIAFWPTLWHNPVLEIKNALSKMSDYPWEDFILFDGRFTLPKDLPWYYLPKWMFISSPLFISVLGVLGVIPWFYGHQRDLIQKLSLAVWIVIPMAIILWKNATVYDGWRHVFFIYPAIVIIALRGAEFWFQIIFDKKHLKWIPIGLALTPIFWMIRNHPNQQVYFNPMYRVDAWNKYEMDYWGLSYYQAYQQLMQERPQGTLRISVANAPGFYNHWLLPEADRERISFVSLDSAEFFLSNFRYPNEHEAATRSEGAYQHPLWVLEVDGNRVCGIFEQKH